MPNANSQERRATKTGSAERPIRPIKRDLVQVLNAARLDHVIARNVRQLLNERGMRQTDLAAAMRERGMSWTANTTAQVLNLYRQLTLVELSGLCAVFQVPLVALLTGEDEIALPSGDQTVPLEVIREVLSCGNAAIPQVHRISFHTEPSEEERKAMQRLGVHIGQLQYLAQHTFGTASIVEERDRRAGDLSGLPKRTAQAKRGHAMRSVLEDLQHRLANSELPR